MTTKHRMSITEDGGNALKALRESTEKGRQTLNMSGMNQLQKKKKSNKGLVSKKNDEQA